MSDSHFYGPCGRGQGLLPFLISGGGSCNDLDDRIGSTKMTLTYGQNPNCAIGKWWVDLVERRFANKHNGGQPFFRYKLQSRFK